MTITKFHCTDDQRQIIVGTSRNYQIYYNAEDSIESQSQKLKELLDQNIIPATIQYVDLRFGDHVYYK